MEQAIYKLLTLNKNAASAMFEALKRVKGLKCKVYLPSPANQPVEHYEEGRNRNIFGLEAPADYDEAECYEDKLLIFNLFQETYAGDDGYDAFTSNTFCLTQTKQKLPLQTLIEINFFGKKLYYKVDDHKTLTPTVVDQLFVKNVLVPAT